MDHQNTLRKLSKMIPKEEVSTRGTLKDDYQHIYNNDIPIPRQMSKLEIYKITHNLTHGPGRNKRKKTKRRKK